MALTVVIRAGGVGSRLWPVSRETAPKQFQKLLGNKTLLEQTYARARKVTDPAHIFVTTNATLAEHVAKQMPGLPKGHMIIEPARRDTGPAIGLESMILAQHDPKAVVLGIPADHVILNEKEFVRLCRVAEKAIRRNPQHLLCMGIKVDYPATAFGYIKVGKVHQHIGKDEIYAVDSFKEKPDRATAKRFFRDWRYLWNANYFVWHVDHMLELYRQEAPEMFKQLQKIAPALGTSREKQVIASVYPKLEKIAVEPLIIEKAKKRLVITANIGWSDIGDWLEVHKLHNQETKKHHVHLDSANNFVHTQDGKIVATIGIENVAIIDTPDALLITAIDRTQDVKKIVEQLKEDPKYRRYL